MTQCAVCGGTIDCSGDDFYICEQCGKAVHDTCAKEKKENEYRLCPGCRKIIDENKRIREKKAVSK